MTYTLDIVLSAFYFNSFNLHKNPVQQVQLLFPSYGYNSNLVYPTDFYADFYIMKIFPQLYTCICIPLYCVLSFNKFPIGHLVSFQHSAITDSAVINFLSISFHTCRSIYIGKFIKREIVESEECAFEILVDTAKLPSTGEFCLSDK